MTSIQPRPAAVRWAAELAGWTIDPEILERAPESPYGLPPALFRAEHRARHRAHHRGNHQGSSPSPLVDAARQAMPAGGALLDVGAGAGASSLPVIEPGQRLLAVDSSAAMLETLREEARDHGVAVHTYEGTWPDIADQVPVCDVVVCAHVAYNVADLASFAHALTAHARRRVVLELHAQHPWVPLGPLWQHFHGQPRPAGPTADLAIEVLREAGISPQVMPSSQPAHVFGDDLWPDYVAFTRRRLCLTPDRDAEVAALLRAQPQEPRESVVLVWDC